MTTSSVRNSLMTSKLKEGVQDAIVYLRMLEGAKLPAVYERKRRMLMDQLLDLQGDTRKDVPPKFESDSDDDDEDSSSVSSPVKRSSAAGEVQKRESKVLDRMSMFERPAPSGGRSFQYKTLEQLKEEKRLSKTDMKVEEPSKEKKEAQKEDVKKAAEEPAKGKGTETNTLEGEGEEKKLTPPSTATPTSVTPVLTPESKRKGRAHSLAGGLLNKVRKRKGDNKEKGASGDTASIDDLSVEEKPAASIELDEEEEEETEKQEKTSEEGEEVGKSKEEQQPPEEEDKPLTSQLERVTKRLGRYTYQKVEMTLLEESVKFWKHNQSREKGTEVSLVGAASAIRDSYQFELHTADKSYTFRTDTEELCSRWISALSKAIEVCNPVQPIEEEPPEEETRVNSGDTPPQITISSGEELSPERKDNPQQGPNTRAYENVVPGGGQKKKKGEMPDFSAAQVKGYMFKKGTFGKWERVWMGLGNDNVLYISTSDSSKKIQGTVTITTDTKIEKKKGSDKLPQALQIVSGKSKDTFATDSLQDYSMWIYCLEQATRPNDIEELLSEDEDGGELYEELGTDEFPTIPSSPRPPPSPRPAHSYQHQPQPAAIDDDIYEGDLDGDIYEGLDEVEMPEEINPQKPPVTPVLPPRNPSDPKVQPPSLPPRNAPGAQVPVLPPRPSKEDNVPQEYEAPKPSPPSQVKHPNHLISSSNDDVYDDVVSAQVADDMEETYDDIESVQPQKKGVSKIVSSDELYEDMTQEEQEKLQQTKLNEDEEYSDMTLEGDGNIDEDFYDDVSAPPPPRPPPPQSSVSKKVTSPLVSKTITSANVRPPPTANTSVRQKSLDSQIPTETSLSTTAIKKASTLPNRPVSSVGTKRLNTSGKVAQMSKMFGQSEDSQGKQKTASSKKGNHSGSLSYKSPGKPSFASNYCVLENNILVFYSSPTDKLSHYRLSLRDAGLRLGAPDGQGAKNVFQILKGTVKHEFSVSSKDDFNGWMGVLVTAAQRMCPEKDELYHAVDDHNGSGEGEVSFKKGAVLWVLQKDSPTQWTGIVGTSDSTFTNAVGTFPSSVVEPMIIEDVYI